LVEYRSTGPTGYKKYTLSVIRRTKIQPKTIQEAETYLDKFPKKTPPAMTSEGTAFAQKGAKGKGGDKDANNKNTKGEVKPYYKKLFANKECFTCGKLGHSAESCLNLSGDNSTKSSS
jgi:hypothetical protein